MEIGTERIPCREWELGEYYTFDDNFYRYGFKVYEITHIDVIVKFMAYGTGVYSLEDNLTDAFHVKFSSLEKELM